MANAPYDPTTLLGLTRLYLADTDVENALFDDPEILAILSVEAQLPLMAAASLLDVLAADASRIARMRRIGRFQEDERDVADNLRTQAATLRSRAVIPVTPNPPDRIFTTDNTALGITGSMTNW